MVILLDSRTTENTREKNFLDVRIRLISPSNTQFYLVSDVFITTVTITYSMVNCVNSERIFNFITIKIVSSKISFHISIYHSDINAKGQFHHWLR